MARQRRSSVDFERRVAQEDLADGVTLVALARHHDISSNLIPFWVGNTRPASSMTTTCRRIRWRTFRGGSRSCQRKVGQLVMENEWLKRGLRRSSATARAAA